jgi:dipeptidase D
MSSSLRDLEPTLLWSHFDDIRQIPRPSKQEQRIAAHVQQWAATRGHQVVKDAAGNMTVRVPATPGHESAPTVILQGHLDMVCEKNADVAHDFDNDPIKVRVEGDWVHADGTTLGADNGIGLATAMAVADDPELVHGPLEILCTVDEETGLTGAKSLDPEIVGGRTMINLDSEEDGVVYIGCAGGADTDADLALARRRGLLGSVPARLAVRGLRGGHSGLNIIDNRGNAIKLAVRVLLTALERGLELDLVSLDGGSKHNAIPREAFAVLRIADDSLDALRAVAASCLDDFRQELAAIEPDMAVEVEPLDEDEEVASPLNVHARDRLLHMLNALPHGVIAMSRDVPGLVETSNNLAVIATTADNAHLITSHRSSVGSALEAVRGQVVSICRQAGATPTAHPAYPGWQPNLSSPVVQRAVEVYTRLFGAKPEIKAIHAGLECGLLIEKVPGMDAVSIGPQIEDVHSPDEKVNIPSVAKFYRHIGALLADLA